jgi:SAM-dependent methyltransferase
MPEFTPVIQGLIDKHFPPETHPYRQLEAAVERYLHPQATVLEIGCGRTAPLLRGMKGRAARLIGTEVIDFAVDDPDLELLRQDVGNMSGIAGNSVDLAFSRSVMEHVPDGEAAFREIARVLKPGGRYIFLTPSLYDYGSLAAALMPNRLHPWIVRRVEGRAEEDTFPTRYQCNTRRRVTRLARGQGLDVAEFAFLGQYPNYLKFSAFLFRLGCWYAKLLARVKLLHPMQGWIFCTVQKPS